MSTASLATPTATARSAAAVSSAVIDSKRPRPRRRTARMRAHQASFEFGGDLGQGGVMAAPGVVDQAGACRAGLLGHLGAPGVDADQLVGEGVAQPLDERHDA